MPIALLKLPIFFAITVLPIFCWAENDDWPDFPVPSDSEKVVVASSMIFNGIPMRMWELNALISPQKLKDFYVSTWNNTPKGLKKSVPGNQLVETDNMIIVSRVESDHLFTVQIEKKLKSSKAYLAISKVRKNDEDGYVIGEGFPVLTGTRIINDIKANDIGKVSRTIVAISDSPLPAVVSFYRSTLIRNGWTDITKSISIDSRGGALMFTKGSKEMNIALIPKNGAINIVAVQVKN
jgi:hypothetical protein